MGNKNNQQSQNNGLDLVAPFVAIFEEVVKLLIEIFQMLLAWLFKKGVEAYNERVLHRQVLRVLDRKMLHSTKSVTNPMALGFATGKRSPLLLNELLMEKHTAIIGSTGSGKTVLLSRLQEHALHSGRSIIFFDPKTCPENIDRFISLCKIHKRKFYIVADYHQGASIFNPLLEGTLSEITERIMSALDWSEPFYKNESQMALYQAIEQIKVVQKEEVTIKKLVTVLESATNRKTISGLLSQLFNIQNSDFAPLLEGNQLTSLTFKKIREEGACVYLGISAIGLGSSGNALNKLFFGGLLYHCKESYLLKDQDALRPFSIFFDELSSIIHEGFIDLQNKCRAVKMEITYATQCPSDIDRLNENLTTQIFENTNNLFIFNQMMPKHTEFFAKTCGTTESIKQTYAIEEGTRSNRGSERETETFLAHANIFRSLRVGQCVFLQRTPKRLELLNISYKKTVIPPSTTKEPIKASLF